MPKSPPLILERSENLATTSLTLVMDMPAQGGAGGDYSIKFYRFKELAASQDELYQVSNATWNGTSWVQDDAGEPSFLKRIGANITYAGQAAGAGPWANNAWIEAFDIVPTGASRGLALEDFQIIWKNTTTGDTGANPAAATDLPNVLAAKNTIKAWGLVSTDSGGQTIIDGFGINSATPFGTDLAIGLSSLMASANYAVVVTENLSDHNGLVPSIPSKSATAFNIRMTRQNGALDGVNLPTNSGTQWRVGFIVMGVQNT